MVLLGFWGLFGVFVCLEVVLLLFFSVKISVRYRVTVSKVDCTNIAEFIVNSAIWWLWDGWVSLLLCHCWNKIIKWMADSLFGVLSEHNQISGHLRSVCVYLFLVYTVIITDNNPMGKCLVLTSSLTKYLVRDHPSMPHQWDQEFKWLMK